MTNTARLYMESWRQAALPNLKGQLNWLLLFNTSTKRQIDERAQQLSITIDEEIACLASIILERQMGL